MQPAGVDTLIPLTDREAENARLLALAIKNGLIGLAVIRPKFGKPGRVMFEALDSLPLHDLAARLAN